MEEDWGHINTFEAYLSGEMAADEKSNFEHQLKIDNRLNVAFEEYKKLKGDIQLAYEYNTFKQQLKNLPEENNKQKSIFLQPKFYIPISIAALIAIIVLTVNPFKFESGDMAMETKSEDDFYSPTAIAEETEASMDSTSIITESYYKVSESEMQASSMRGNAILIYGNDILVTTIKFPQELSEVQLKSMDQTFTGQVIPTKHSSELTFIKLNYQSQTNSEVFNFKMIDYETLPKPEVKVLYYQEEFNSNLEFSLIKSKSNNFYSRKSENKLELTYTPEYLGSAVVDADQKLIGIVSNKKNKDNSVTYFISSHYIGIELDKLLEEHKELKKTMSTTLYINDIADSQKIGKNLVFAVYY